MDGAIQEFYPEEVSHCYGCGRLNDHGLHIKSYWDGEEAVCTFQPAEYHISVPGYVYGGLIASLIDCHSTGAAAGAAARAGGKGTDDAAAFRFVTASLKVDYLKPTPLGVPLEVRARVTERSGRKAVVSAAVFAQGVECARGEVVTVLIPDRLLQEIRGQAPGNG